MGKLSIFSILLNWDLNENSKMAQGDYWVDILDRFDTA